VFIYKQIDKRVHDLGSLFAISQARWEGRGEGEGALPSPSRAPDEEQTDHRDQGVGIRAMTSVSGALEYRHLEGEGFVLGSR